MIKYAIVGNIASGKSVVEKILKASGFSTIDTDNIAQNVRNKFQNKIKNAFKDFDILENNKISPKKLGAVIFDNKKMKKILEDIMYPEIKKEIKKFYKAHNDEKKVFVSIPLLFEAKMEDFFDKIIFIEANDDLRLKRLMKRNSLNRKDALKRMNSQMKQEEKFSKSDYVIHNNGEINDIKDALFKILF